MRQNYKKSRRSVWHYLSEFLPPVRGEGLLGVGFYAEKRRDVIPANVGIQGE